MSSHQRESVRVLQECIDLQIKKSQDYQNEKSNIVQAMHYRRGVSTIHDMIHQKLLRAQSLLEAAEDTGAVSANFESLEDSYKDLINYASFAVSYIRGKMDGQNLNRDMLNRPIHTELNLRPIGYENKQMIDNAFLAETKDVGDRMDEDIKEFHANISDRNER